MKEFKVYLIHKDTGIEVGESVETFKSVEEAAPKVKETVDLLTRIQPDMWEVVIK